MTGAEVVKGAPGGAGHGQLDEPGSWELGGRTLDSRLIVGTGGAPSLDVLGRVIAASGTGAVTVAMRRVAPGGAGSLLGALQQAGVRILPNTAGCHTASEALFTARLGREALGTDWVSWKSWPMTTRCSRIPGSCCRPRASSSQTGSPSFLTPTTTRSSPGSWKARAVRR